MIPRLQISFPLCYSKEYWLGKPYFAAENEFLLNHARSGILLALKAVDLPTEAGVGVMIFNCHTVVNAVAQAGFRPVFLDVTDELRLDLKDLARKADGLAALVVTHLFGILNDVKAIRLRYPNMIIIEDCAHAYGIKELNSDFAVFSIGQGKNPSIGDGGILKVLNNRYLQKTEDIFNMLPEYTWGQRMKLFFKLFGKAMLYRPWVYGWLTLPLKRKCPVQSGKELIIQRKMCRGIRNIYKIEKERVIPRDAFMQVIYCDNPEEEKESYKRNGIDTDTHFGHSIQWAREFGYEFGDCPNAEKLVNHLLMVPNYFNR